MPGPTVKELKAQAKARGVKGYSKMKKAELIHVLGAPTKSSGPRMSPPPQKVTYRWQVLLSDAMWEIGTGKKPKDTLGFVDFRKETSSLIENRWKDFQNSEGSLGYVQKASSPKVSDTQFDLPTSQSMSGGKINFKKMVLKWVLKMPVGTVEVVNQIRRVAN